MVFNGEGCATIPTQKSVEKKITGATSVVQALFQVLYRSEVGMVEGPFYRNYANHTH